MIAKEDLHALDLEKKNNEIKVSAFIDIIAIISTISHKFIVRPLLR
jgi:hypothetical protein